MAWDPRVLAALKSRAEAEGLPLEMFAQPKAIPGYGVDQLKAAQEEDVGAARQADSHAVLASLVNGLASRRAAQFPTTRAPVMDENVKRYLMQRQMAAAEQGPAPADVLGAIQGAAKEQAAIGKTRAETGEIAARTPGVAADASVKQGLAGAVSPATSQIAAGYKMQFPPGTTEEIARKAIDDRAKQEGFAIDWSKVGVEKDKAALAKDTRSKDVAAGLRKEFQGNQVYKDAQQVAASFEKVKTATPTSAGDIALVYGFMKLLDPGSAVREGEYATAANAGGAFQKLGNIYNAVLKGEKLPDQVRTALKAEAGGVYRAQMQRYEALAAPYRGLAQKEGVPPEDVVLPFAQEAEPGAAPAAADSALRKKYGLE